ncbi:MAG: hypothetical protein WCA46_26685 [Actinocatenispora sp.]
MTGPAGGTGLDGSWEDAVARVVVAGEPRTVHSLAQAWKRLADGMPDHQRALGELVGRLCQARGGWQGKASDEYQKIVKRISDEIGALHDDCTQMAANLGQAGQTLSEAIARIPVPLVKVGAFDIDHELPNGTAMDDSLRDPNTFDSALAADYDRDPGGYRDFRAITAGRGANNLRTGVAGAEDYRGTPGGPTGVNPQRELDAWYYPNAAAADRAFRHLRQQYTDQRTTYNFSSNEIGEVRGYGNKEESGTGAKTASGLADHVSQSVGAAPHLEGSPSSGRGDLLARGRDNPGDVDKGSTDPNSKLAGAQDRISNRDIYGIPSAARPASLGASTDLPGGVISPGVSSSGHNFSPMPPLARPNQAGIESGAGEGRIQSLSPSMSPGLMSNGAGNRVGERDQRTTWLTEDDENIFSAKLAPPGVIE